jgi:hypothetical protein
MGQGNSSSIIDIPIFCCEPASSKSFRSELDKAKARSRSQAYALNEGRDKSPGKSILKEARPRHSMMTLHDSDSDPSEPARGGSDNHQHPHAHESSNPRQAYSPNHGPNAPPVQGSCEPTSTPPHRYRKELPDYNYIPLAWCERNTTTSSTRTVPAAQSSGAQSARSQSPRGNTSGTNSPRMKSPRGVYTPAAQMSSGAHSPRLHSPRGQTSGTSSPRMNSPRGGQGSRIDGEDEEQPHQPHQSQLEEQHPHADTRKQKNTDARFCCDPVRFKAPKHKLPNRDEDEIRVHISASGDTADIPLSEFQGKNMYVQHAAESNYAHAKSVHWKN